MEFGDVGCLRISNAMNLTNSQPILIENLTNPPRIIESRGRRQRRQPINAPRQGSALPLTACQISHNVEPNVMLMQTRCITKVMYNALLTHTLTPGTRGEVYLTPFPFPNAPRKLHLCKCVPLPYRIHAFSRMWCFTSAPEPRPRAADLLFWEGGGVTFEGQKQRKTYMKKLLRKSCSA